MTSSVVTSDYTDELPNVNVLATEPVRVFKCEKLFIQNRTEKNKTLLITVHLRPHAGGVREKGMQYMQSIVIIHK